MILFESDTHNKPLTARLFTAEMAIWLCTMIFMFGMGYSALATDNENQSTAIRDLKDAERSVTTNFSQIKVSISHISATQAAMSERIRQQQHSIEKLMERQENDARDILSILRPSRSDGP